LKFFTKFEIFEQNLYFLEISNKAERIRHMAEIKPFSNLQKSHIPNLNSRCYLQKASWPTVYIFNSIFKNRTKKWKLNFCMIFLKMLQKLADEPDDLQVDFMNLIFVPYKK